MLAWRVVRAWVSTALIAACMVLGEARAAEPRVHVGGSGFESDVIRERIATASPRLIPERTEQQQARRSPDAPTGPFVPVAAIILPRPNSAPAVLATSATERTGGLFARAHGARGPPSSRRS